MLTRHAGLRMLPILLIVAVLSAACDVPDISEFTKQSAEMTRGIRTGVKDTESVIKTASVRTDLYTPTTLAKLRKQLKEYQTGLKPTVEVLDALDSYLEALNALAQANNKSEENSAGAVNAVFGLVTAVSGLTFASSAVNVATGLVTLAEEFRTARAFKKRVNAAAQIVEGRYDTQKDAAGNVLVDSKGKPKLFKTCVGDAEDKITEASGRITERIASAMERAETAAVSQLQKDTLSQQIKTVEKLSSPKERREKLREFGIITGLEFTEIETAENTIAEKGCGVLDLIKFNVRDLKRINLEVSRSIYDNAKDKNRTVLGFYDALVSTDRRIQNELETILNYKTLAALIREYEATGVDPASILDSKIRLKEQSDNLFIADAQLKADILRKLDECAAACGNMKDILLFDLGANDEAAILGVIGAVSKAQFDASNGYIEKVLESRAAELYDHNAKYLDELQRITPAHTTVINELKTMSEKQNQLDKLLDSSISALDAWAKSHANLRVAVNTNKPLTVSQLTSKVREIWAIIEPDKK